MSRTLFVKGAYLYTFDEELPEKEFIKKAGKHLMEFRQYPFVSLVLDNQKKPILVGHNYGRAINATMVVHGHKEYQTMEWKK